MKIQNDYEVSMKVLLNVLFLFSLCSFQAVTALPKGSPDRCKKADWSRVDDLLPKRSDNGGYPQPMSGIEKKISKISPKQILQSTIDHLLTFNDFCGNRVAGVGGWEDSIGTDLCERLTAYNMTHDGVLSGNSDSSPKKPLFSPSDLDFLKSVYQACRPSTNRWWNYSLINHVSFKPTPEEYKHFRQVLMWIR